MKRVPTGTGRFERVAVPSEVALPQPSGKHYWVVIPIYQVDNPARETLLLARESLLTVRGPSCLHCDVEWDVTVGAHCPVKPS